MSAVAGTVIVNGLERVWSGTSLDVLLGREGVDTARPGIAVAVNGEVVPRTEWSTWRIEPGDRIDIVGAVAGG